MYIAFAVKRLHASNCTRTSPCLHACAYAHTCVRVCVCVRMQHDYDSFYPPGMAEKANAKSQLRCCAHSCCSCGAVPIRAAVAVQCLLEGDGDALVIISIGHSAAERVCIAFRSVIPRQKGYVLPHRRSRLYGSVAHRHCLSRTSAVSVAHPAITSQHP